MEKPLTASPIVTCKRRQAGSAYLLFLMLIALSGAGLAQFGKLWATQTQRDKEAELLWIGQGIRNAIGRYYENSPGTQKSYPKQLSDLELDPRVPFTRRFLRQISIDPMTGGADWALIQTPQGGIVGVASRSEQLALKTAEFPAELVMFEGLPERLSRPPRYRDWEFIYLPATEGSRP